MYCIKCGHELPDDANYCDKCGTKVKNDFQDDIKEVVSSSSKKISDNINELKNKPVVSKGKNWLKQALLLVVGIIFAAVGKVFGRGFARTIIGSNSNSLMMYIAGGICAGILCGLVPYYISKKYTYYQENNTTSYIFIIVCGVAGLIGGLILGIISACILTIWVVYKGKQMKRRDNV